MALHTKLYTNIGWFVMHLECFITKCDWRLCITPFFSTLFKILHTTPEENQHLNYSKHTYFFQIFIPCIFVLCLYVTNKCTDCISLLLYSAAPTCFDTCVSSSGSSSVPAELHANRMQWLIRLCVIRCYVSVYGGLVCTDRCIPGLHKQTHNNV
jgi:hypothetical protein